MTTGSDWITRIECRLDGDPRLIEGASEIVAHVARQAGLSDAVIREIADAALQACGAVSAVFVESGIVSAKMKLATAEFPDRIEVTIEPSSDQWNAARARGTAASSASFADKVREKLKSTAVDGLDIESIDGAPRVTLVKKTGAAKRRFVF